MNSIEEHDYVMCIVNHKYLIPLTLLHFYMIESDVLTSDSVDSLGSRSKPIPKVVTRLPSHAVSSQW